MPILPRTLRAIVEASPFKAPPRSPRRQARYDRILGAAGVLFETVGRENITMASLALALDIAPTTLRRDILDIDHLFAEILRPQPAKSCQRPGRNPQLRPQPATRQAYRPQPPCSNTPSVPYEPKQELI